MSLCRSLEKLDPDQLRAKVESLQDTLVKLAGAKEKAGEVVESVKGFFQSIGNFFSNLFSKK